MQIPSWAFASAGKSLIGYISETDLQVIRHEPVRIPEPVRTTEPVRLPEPLRDTFYDCIIEIINDIIPKQNTILNICIELYT